MIDRLILGVVLSVVGWNGLFPAPTPPVTPKTLKAKSKRTISKVKSVLSARQKQNQSKTVQRICKRWKEQQNG
jgi:hypothetical protein